jgi:hypothetical protein
MTADEFISEAIAAGEFGDLSALDADQRLVYLISEAECFCDLEGIDSFIARYAPTWIAETAAAFEAVGAADIAAEFRTVPLDADVGDFRLNRLNDLITRRAGYDYEAIRRVVEARHASGR